MEKIILMLLLIVFSVLFATGCASFKGGTVGIPELQPGDRVVVEYQRAERRMSK